MTLTDELCVRLNELGIKYTTDDSNDYEIIEWQGPYNLWWQFVCDPYEEEPYGELRLVETGGATHLTPEQAIAATVGVEKWEPSKEWKVWYDSLKHDNPTSIREAVENILYEAIDFGGDMGPNGNVWSGVDEGTVLTENCIDGWVESVESIAATVGAGTCHLEECEHEREVPYDLPDCDGGWYTEVTHDCDECGYENADPNIRFCGGCGRKVVTE